MLAAAKAGADWAWTRLYRDLAPAVLGYLRTHGCPDAEDALGDTFVDLARNIERFEGDEQNLRSFVFTVAHHKMIDRRRQRRRRPLELVAEPIEIPVLDLLEDEAVSADQARWMLDCLTPDQRAVVLLRVLGGLTVEEVSGAIGKPVTAVKALQRRGLAALARHLEAVSP
jgi:RNA polymerase sigma-70 factor (ECF subfamily)